jgi:hypothetical protein
MDGGMKTEKQELHCHNCNRYVQFEIDLELNGNHVLACPNCGHEHCRVVKDGIITDVRWGQRNNSLPTYRVSTATSTVSSTYDTYSGTGTGTGGNTFLYRAWMDTTTTQS